MRQRRGPVGFIDLSVGPAEVRDQDHARTAFEEVRYGLDRLANAGIVGDPPVLDRNVEIDSNQDTLAGDVDVADGGFLERAADRGVRGQFSRSPMKTVRA